MLRKTLLNGLAALAISALAIGVAAAQQKTKLTVYTALENDQLKPIKDAFERDNPAIEIVWVRDSTGVITARILAEKDNPRADIIIGLAATSLIGFDTLGMLEAYTPKGADKLKPAFRSAKSPMTWTGMDAYLSVVCFNTAEAQKAGAPKPASWSDLTNPKFKGQVVMPHPASSGTGYLTIGAWIQVMGEQKAWEFMDKLHDNIAVYTHSGSAPCVQAAKGERMVGIGLDMRAAREKSQGAPIDIVLPKDGLGWEMEATAIVKGTKNAEAAKALADWSVSKQANELYSKFYAIMAHPDGKSLPANYPPAAEAMMVKNDFAWMAAQRDRVLAEWKKRYEGKAAPK
jgi:iron(III) transport system substrate-binding protein